MGLFKKNETADAKETLRKDNTLRDEISQAYDEITAGGLNTSAEKEEKAGVPSPDSLQAEILKTRIKIFKDKKDRQSLLEVIKLLPNREFLLPSISNIKEPFEKTGDTVRLKEGAELNPALLTSKDNKVFLPIFTDEKSMTQKSPSGVVLKFKFEQCVSIVYDKKNPVFAVVINPFTENMIIGEDLLRMAFKPKENK